MQYQFITREERAQVAVREIHLQGRLSAAGAAVSLTSGQGVYRTLKVVSECEVEIGVDAARMLRDPSEHHNEAFIGDFWVDWNGPRGGVTLTIRQAPQNFPKRLRATPDALEAFLYPRRQSSRSWTSRQSCSAERNGWQRSGKRRRRSKRARKSGMR